MKKIPNFCTGFCKRTAQMPQLQATGVISLGCVAQLVELSMSHAQPVADG